MPPASDGGFLFEAVLQKLRKFLQYASFCPCVKCANLFIMHKQNREW